MIEEETSFQAGFEFEPILRLLSKQIYETPLAFIRENVQNAVDGPLPAPAHPSARTPRWTGGRRGTPWPAPL